MNTIHTGRNLFRGIGYRFFQAAILALAVAMASPARAADDRAVKAKVPPVYPEIAKRMKIAGLVRVEATVDAEGKVTDVKVLSGNSMLAPAAEDAIRKWRFEPASASSTVEVALNFALAQ